MLGVLNGCGGRRRLYADRDQEVAGQSTRTKRNKLRIGVLPSCLGASSSTSAPAPGTSSLSATSHTVASAAAAAVMKRQNDRFHRPRVPTPNHHQFQDIHGRPDVRNHQTAFRSKDSTSTLTSVVNVPDNDDAFRRRQSPVVTRAAQPRRFNDHRNFRNHYETFAGEDVGASIDEDSLTTSDECLWKTPSQLRRRRNDDVIVVHSRSSISTFSTAGATGNGGNRTARVRDSLGAARTVVATKTEVECRVRRTSFVAESTSLRDRRRLDASVYGVGAESASTWWPDAALSRPRSELADSGYAGTTVVSADRTDAGGSICWNDVHPAQPQGWIRDCARLGRVTEECGDAGDDEETRLVNCSADVRLTSDGVRWTEDISAGERLRIFFRS